MRALKVPVIVVCGHTDCGVMKALLRPEQVADMPGVQKWMSHAFEAREQMLREFGDAPEEEQLRRMTEFNVLGQIENLKTHPSVSARLLRGRLRFADGCMTSETDRSARPIQRAGGSSCWGGVRE